MVRTKRVFVIASLALILPTAVAAQQRSPAPAAARQAAAAPSQQQMQQWVTELRQLHQQLEQIQARASQDPQIQAAQNALGLEIKAAMEKADPQLPTQMQRLQALEEDAVKAQQAGDQAKLQRLIQEAQTIQTRFVEAQARVFQQPAMAAKVEAFQTRLEARMAQVDAQAPTLIKRFQELEGKLNAAMQVSQQR